MGGIADNSAVVIWRVAIHEHAECFRKGKEEERAKWLQLADLLEELFPAAKAERDRLGEPAPLDAMGENG